MFTRMAETGSMSLGMCIGEWLTDTIDGAQFVAQKMAEARKAPRVVMREMQAFARGVVDEVDDCAADLRRATSGPAAQRQGPTVGGAPSPPSSNTGGKLPNTRKTGRES